MQHFTRGLRAMSTLGLLTGASLIAMPAFTDAAPFCTMTANAAYLACHAELKDDFWITTGNCLNISDPEERRTCNQEASRDRSAEERQCEQQFQARLRLCELIGEDRYAPDFRPARFVNPHDIGQSVAPNPYFPLVPGTRWVYRNEDERITVTVTDRTKLIQGVRCRVVTDVVREGDDIIESTDDWYAQDVEGNVWYCGEIARDFTTFEGDNPAEAELVDIDGSWKAGRDGARPGIIMFANPQVGTTYRQEMALGEAEDAATILSIRGSESVPAASCTDNCVVTRDFTPLEPGVKERKYYAPGVGLILEIDDEGNRTELIRFTMP